MKKFQFCMMIVALLPLVSNSPAQAVQGNQQKAAKSSQAMSKGKISLEENITAMERRAWEAVKARDSKSFSGLFAEDGMMTDNGGIITRATFFQTLPDLVISDYTLTNIKVMMIDKDSALITYTANVKGSYKGQAFPDKPTYTSTVWAKRGGKWMAVYHQETMAQ